MQNNGFSERDGRLILGTIAVAEAWAAVMATRGGTKGNYTETQQGRLGVMYRMNVERIIGAVGTSLTEEILVRGEQVFHSTMLAKLPER